MGFYLIFALAIPASVQLVGVSTWYLPA